MIRRPPRSTLLTHSFPTRRSSDLTLRRVWLDNGEVFFEIAHDAAHPFVIFAGPKRITVLGTKFSVRRDGDKVSVSVLEGRVRIDDVQTQLETGNSSATITGGVLAVTNGPSTLVTQRAPDRVDRKSKRLNSSH